MLQAIIKKGKAFPTEVPAPTVSEGSLLIRVINSCISAGTELSSVEGSGKSLIRRALEQPAALKQVIDFARSQGIAKTLQRIRGTLEDGKPIGYSVAGMVVGIGPGVGGFSVGDRVAAAGAGIANHAEFVDVPRNLVMRIPDGVSYVDASTVTLGGIALQGVRRCDLRLGELCVVLGTGILGLLAVQLLRASGVRVVAVDVDTKRLALAADLGAERVVNSTTADPVAEVNALTGGLGVDAVLFTAATASSEPLSQAFRMCRKKGRVVLVGVSGMEIRREDMYQKELDFLISTSYGPGRYDRIYEEKGMEYPFGYVRWTENRNMSEYLRLIAAGQVRLGSLVNAVYPIQEVQRAFEDLGDPKKRPIISVLDYGTAEDGVQMAPRTAISVKQKPVDKERIGVAVIGAGNFATSVHLPNLSRLDKEFDIRTIVSKTGHKASAVASRYGGATAATDIQHALDDPAVDLVMICTRHENHAELALRSLRAGKHVFVEKPLAVTHSGLQDIVKFYEEGDRSKKPLLMVGFNRRFSPYAREIQNHTSQRANPLFAHYRMNAGFLPDDHWVHDAGGRIVGEACHIVDLMTFLTGSKVKSVSVSSLTVPGDETRPSDNKSIQLSYADGSLCIIDYLAVGNSSLPKEYMDVHFDGKSIVLDDYRSLAGYGVSVKEIKTSSSQKGHYEELLALAEALKGKSKSWPIELWDLAQTTEVALVAGG